MVKKSTFPVLIGLIGLALAGTAVFAGSLGLDPSAGWGRTRIALLILGLCIILLAILFWIFVDQTNEYLRKIRDFVADHPLTARLRNNPGIIYLSDLLKKYWVALPILLAVILVYIWFVSTGSLTTWVSPTHLYADLARGFLKGRLYLPIKPGADQLKSPDLNNGSGLQGPLDISYFQGKYYLYWGPVPALVLVLIHPLIFWRLGDLQLVFAFFTGLYVFQSVLAVWIWDRYFSQLPKYILWLSILLVGLAGPVTFMLNNYKSARIYEAAITGGQFFLMGGFMLAVTALGPPVSRWRLALAGTLWALAVGTRLILALPVAFMALMVAGWILWTHHWSIKKVAELIPLIIPLVLGLACLGWYNWARFGSVLETGFIYQIPGSMNVHRQYGDIINPLFIPQNLYNYFLNPFDVRSQFPYLYAKFGNVKAIFPAYALPGSYSAQPITGLLYSLPFIIFGIISPVILLGHPLKMGAVQKSLANDERRMLDWITLTLSGACLLVFGFLLTYYWTAARFLEDVEPLLVLLSLIGFWQGYRSLANKPGWRRFYIVFGVLLIGASILMSTLVALSVNYARFEVVRFLPFLK